MIWTLQIKLLSGHWAEKDWAATIALDASSTLEDLHYIIQQAVDFDDDHLYGFFVARTPRSRDRVRYNYDPDDEEDDRLYTTTLESLFPLPKGRKLFYLFDYGDYWIFQISRTRSKPFAAQPGVDYPSLIDESGEKPEQYPAFE
ncbi:hypothetical protein [uncultured Thiodictyon sp.]|jgi:hypothetical protein|uniref:IS1096 element passenger TnpR family protein n=1 Tax=uncultured Thiodictyon sp. TaxID=1846217 RepID=UPI0025D0D240|nr:hypothetical protein [uncultured Thiodictyon sp.]